MCLLPQYHSIVPQLMKEFFMFILHVKPLRLREVKVSHNVDEAESGVSLRFCELSSPTWAVYCFLFIK